MKLAFCLFKYFPFGGLQRNMLAIAKACVARGHQVEIYTGSWEGDKPAGFSINLVRVTGVSNHRRNKTFYEGCQKQLSGKHYDLVVGFNKMPGLDVYYAADSCFATKAFEMKGPLYRATPRSKISLQFEDGVFGESANTHTMLVSEKEKPAFLKYYHTPESRFHVLPPGISKDRILPDDYESIRENFRQEFSIADDEKVLLALGSGFKTKGLDRSIAALASLTGTLKSRLLVVGQDNPKNFIRLAEKMGVGDRVTFFSGRDDVPRFLLGSDCLIHPAYRENTGNVLLEAMVSGLPVLTTDVCGYAHYVTQGGMGSVMPSPYQPEETHQALAALLQVDRSKWFELGKIFSTTANIYHRPETAADIIEQVGRERMRLAN